MLTTGQSKLSCGPEITSQYSKTVKFIYFIYFVLRMSQSNEKYRQIEETSFVLK